ncbi:MAG TPA: DUF2306 domain-containing protein [Caulobacteraceae bacterium]|nr:DUF2306 domain-containing protein [Caulobacteraceae bacterium]
MVLATTGSRRPALQPAWLMAALAAIAVGLVSYRYLVPGAPGLSPNVVANPFTRYGFLTVHAGFAATALILGPWQFLPRLRASRPRLHRWIGRSYATCCLIAGAAGLALAIGTTSGLPAALGFGFLAVASIGATSRAWIAATRRDFVAHRRFMIRSYALTFAAVTLRIYLPISLVLHFDFVTAYQVISWLAWVPNLILAEIYIRRA